MTAQRIPWSELREDFTSTFKQGDHVAIIGPTGQGKSTLALSLLDTLWERGASILFLANKPSDPLLGTISRSRNWARIKKWPPTYADRQKRRVLLWPSYGLASRSGRNAPVFTQAMDYALLEGGWVVYIDETRYFIEQLGMRRVVDEYWNAARSSRVTLIAGSQGPTWINRTMITQETWLFMFRPRHAEDFKVYAEAAGNKDVVPDLQSLNSRKHEFLIAHTPTGNRYISHLEV